MPQYLSTDGLRDRHGAEFFVHGITGSDEGGEDIAAAARAIRDAEAKVDSYLGTRNKLPLPGVTDREDPEDNTSVPEVLRSLVADIAIYRMAADHDRLTKEKRQRYEDACKWLERYADSKVSLGIEGKVPSAIGVHLVSSKRVLSRADTDGLL